MAMIERWKNRILHAIDTSSFIMIWVAFMFVETHPHRSVFTFVVCIGWWMLVTYSEIGKAHKG